MGNGIRTIFPVDYIKCSTWRSPNSVSAETMYDNENNSPNILSDKNYPVSSQEFWQTLSVPLEHQMLRQESPLYMHIYPTPPLGQDMTQGQFLSGVYQV